MAKNRSIGLKQGCCTGLQKIFKGQVKVFLVFPGPKGPGSIEKLNLTYQVWSHKGSTFFKKGPHFGQNSFPGEYDPNMTNMTKRFQMVTKHSVDCWLALCQDSQSDKDSYREAALPIYIDLLSDFLQNIEATGHHGNWSFRWIYMPNLTVHFDNNLMCVFVYFMYWR